jgi:hypothetical protein
MLYFEQNAASVVFYVEIYLKQVKHFKIRSYEKFIQNFTYFISFCDCDRF